MSAPEGPRRLDPGRAAEQARAEPGQQRARPADLPREPIDTRRYQWMIGGFGLVLLIVFSVYLYTGRGTTSPGVPAGQPIHRFVAPLASSNLNVPANVHPRCDRSRPARRGLNVCGRGALVLAFFVTDAGPCVSEIDTLQALSHRFPGLPFAAVAVSAGRARTAQLVRRHHWTIPVAYDLSGAIGQLYGVVVCPIIELVRPGGIVEQRLIGERWRSPTALEAPLARLARLARGTTARSAAGA